MTIIQDFRQVRVVTNNLQELLDDLNVADHADMIAVIKDRMQAEVVSLQRITDNYANNHPSC